MKRPLGFALLEAFLGRYRFGWGPTHRRHSGRGYCLKSAWKGLIRIILSIPGCGFEFAYTFRLNESYRGWTIDPKPVRSGQVLLMDARHDQPSYRGYCLPHGPWTGSNRRIKYHAN